MEEVRKRMATREALSSRDGGGSSMIMPKAPTGGSRVGGLHIRRRRAKRGGAAAWRVRSNIFVMPVFTSRSRNSRGCKPIVRFWPQVCAGRRQISTMP